MGLDINPAMLAVARTLPPVAGAPVRWLASAYEVPLPDAAFDVVALPARVPAVPGPAGRATEMRRVLVPGGRLAISVWSQIEDSPGMLALVRALERHVGVEAANNRRAPFALGDAAQLHGLLADAGFRDIEIRTLVETARFSSPESLVEAQLSATPLSTLRALSQETRQAVARDVRAALGGYLNGDELAVPMATYVALAQR